MTYVTLTGKHRNTLHCIVLATFLVMLTMTAHARQTGTPYGIFQFCSTYPAQCKPHKETTVQYSRRLISLLNRVNRAVNARISPHSDKLEAWRINPRRGDCDDYMVTKRADLIRAGLPPGAVFMIVVDWKRSGQKHALTGVRSSRGVLILDNLGASVRFKHRTPYKFIKRSTGDPMVWVTY